MTRKDWKKFAEMLKALKTQAQQFPHIDTETLGIVQVDMSRILEDDNPEFDYQKWFDSSRPEVLK